MYRKERIELSSQHHLSHSSFLLPGPEAGYNVAAVHPSPESDGHPMSAPNIRSLKFGVDAIRMRCL